MIIKPHRIEVSKNVVYYNSVKEAILAHNPEFVKVLAPELAPQHPTILKFIDAAKQLGKKCGIDIKGYFPEDIAKYAKKVQYLKQDKNSNALKSLVEMFSKYSPKGVIGEVLLKIKLKTEGDKILNGIKLKKFKI